MALLIMAVVGPRIKRASPGPILFKQERVGQNGKHFTMYKIRSMYMDAEARKAEAEQRKAIAKEKAAASAASKARSEEAAAKHKADTARDERVAKEKAAEEAKADERTAAAQKATAEAEAKTAADAARKSEAEAKIAADRRAVAEALAAHSIATNETRLAELRLAENARMAVEADIRRTEAENKSNELKKLDLDKRLAEVAELQETLRQREEATRPERTINDIISRTTAAAPRRRRRPPPRRNVALRNWPRRIGPHTRRKWNADAR
jgi:hypothetical protein